MDSIFETMDVELANCLKNAGVKQEVLDALDNDELYTVEELDATSDNLLHQCGIKAGQISRLRNGIKNFKEMEKECDVSGIYPMRNSSPLIIPSMPKAQTMQAKTSPQMPSLSEPSPLTPTKSNIPKPKRVISTSSPLTSSPCSQSSNSLSETENEKPDCPNISCFAESKVLKNGKWLQKFELPTKFSSRVSQALEERKMSSSERNDFTRDVTTSIMAYTLYPTKSEREHVAFMIVKKYPFLADKLGTGIGSWEQAIKYRLKNRRKNKPQTSKRPSPKLLETLKPKKMLKTLDLGRIPEKPVGETKDTCREHALKIRKEMMKSSNRNACSLRELMELTYPFRREEILMEPIAVKDVLKEYPALKLVSEFKSEFGRVMGDGTLLKTMAGNFSSVLKPKVLALAKEKSLGSRLMEDWEEAISNGIGRKSDIEDTAAMMLLPDVISSKGTSGILKICSDDESIDDVIGLAVAPQLIAGGDMGDMSPLYLVIEKEVVLRFNNTVPAAQVLAMLVASYYIFNIEYPSHWKNIFVMLEATIMGLPQEARKRVAVNKFLQEINYEQ